MKNLFFILALITYISGCQKTISTENPSTLSDSSLSCRIAPNKLFIGQIAYFDGMILKLPSCPIIRNFQFSSSEESLKVLAELNLDPAAPESDFLYVNIDFYASVLSDGKVIIQSVEKAELTEQSIFNF